MVGCSIVVAIDLVPRSVVDDVVGVNTDCANTVTDATEDSMVVIIDDVVKSHNDFARVVMDIDCTVPIGEGIVLD